ncbi:MAG: adenylate/guanylate cyclase domain-containing protein [Aestuariivirga sp.]
MQSGTKIKVARLFRAILLALTVVAALCWLRLADPAPIANLRASDFDLMQQLWPRQQTSNPVVIVDIDESSLARIGQWPWSRDKLAKMVENLNALGAKVIAFDVIFPEPDQQSPATVLRRPELADAAKNLSSPLPDTDAIFAEAVAHTPVVAAAAQVSSTAPNSASIKKAGFAIRGTVTALAAPQLQGLISNLPALNAAAKGLGLINIDLATESGVARNVPLLWSDGKDFLPSLSLEVLRVAQNESTYLVSGSPNIDNAIESVRVGKYEIPTNENGLFQLYYRPPRAEDSYSAALFLDSSPDEKLRSKIDGKLVLIGTSAAGLGDRRISSLGQTVPGVSVHAQAIEQILAGQYLARGEWVTQLELLYIVAAALLFALCSIFLRPGMFVAAWITSVAATLYGATFFFRHSGLMFDATFPLMASTLLFLSLLATKLLVTERYGRSLRHAFSHYLAPPLLTQIEDNPGALKLGGEQREITVMFVDIKNFTPMTEKLAPNVLVALINQVLSLCTTAVLDEQGTLDKYIGDAVMAFWNAPLDIAQHQYHAAAAALKIQNAITAFNLQPGTQSMLNEAKLQPIGLRIGIATGLATVGNMGSSQRFDYSALGEPVNMAARAEQACKQVGADIVIAGQLIGRTTTLSTLDAGKLSFRGLSHKVQCYAVFGHTKDDAHKQADMALFSFQSGTRLLQPKLAAHYSQFITALVSRRTDYGLKN